MIFLDFFTTKADIYLIFSSLIVSFTAVGLKGFQHKNVIKNKKKSVFVVSYLMAAFEVVSVGIIVKGGWVIALSAGTGAALGMVVAMHLHDKLYGE
jgi:hypothetical protein